MLVSGATVALQSYICTCCECLKSLVQLVILHSSKRPFKQGPLVRGQGPEQACHAVLHLWTLHMPVLQNMLHLPKLEAERSYYITYCKRFKTGSLDRSICSMFCNTCIVTCADAMGRHTGVIFLTMSRSHRLSHTTLVLS